MDNCGGNCKHEDKQKNDHACQNKASQNGKCCKDTVKNEAEAKSTSAQNDGCCGGGCCN